MLNQTPLYENHKKLGAKLVSFAGWEMPVEYSGLRKEHLNVRSHVGLFDVSHMGEIIIEGPQALPFIERLTSNFVGKLASGDAQYSLFLNEKGGVIDDLIVYCLEINIKYLLVVNASNKEKDLSWILSQKSNWNIEIIDQSSHWGQIAVQGPKAIDLLTRIFKNFSREKKQFTFESYSYQGDKVLVARTGYTGEDGVEIYVPWALTSALWDEALEKGKDLGVLPIGLGARDTLRLEKKFSLYGHELTDDISPLEVGLKWAVKPDKKDFIGKAAYLKDRSRKDLRSLIGFQLIDKGIARENYDVFDSENNKIGWVTSGTFSPCLEKSIGLVLVQKKIEENEFFFIKIRDRFCKAQAVKTPFV